jgi:hypothetical protein
MESSAQYTEKDAAAEHGNTHPPPGKINWRNDVDIQKTASPDLMRMLGCDACGLINL